MGEMDKVWQIDLVSIGAATGEIRDRLLGRGEFAQEPSNMTADAAFADLLRARTASRRRRRSAIVCLRYCRGIDRAESRDTLRSAYWPDAVDDHVLFNGNAYDFIDWCLPLLVQVEHSQHLLGNILIEIDGDTARAESYYHAYERRRRRRRGDSL